MDILLVVLLIIAGVVLLVLELFLLPGFGIAGVSGFLSLAGAVLVAYLKISATAGHITLGAALLTSALAVYAFFRSQAIEKIGLDTTIDSKVTLASPGRKIENLERDAHELEQQKEQVRADSTEQLHSEKTTHSTTATQNN